jgi:hypothetical protein
MIASSRSLDESSLVHVRLIGALAGWPRYTLRR